MAGELDWTTPTWWLGIKGLQLNKALDQLDPQECSRLSNLVHTGGPLSPRPGQTVLATSPGVLHSIRRLNDPKNATYTRFWGNGSSWSRGQSGAVAALETGFSGNPLTFVTTRPPFSGEAWMVAADTSKMRKASRTSPSLPLGLPIPTGLTTAIQAILRTNLCAFDSGDSTQASKWTAAGGYDTTQGALAGTPVLTDVTGVSGNAVNVATTVGNATKGYLSSACVPRVANASIIGGVATASDDDIIHILIRIDQPSAVEEVRLYFVCSPFSAVALSIPGTSTTQNVAAYMRAYRPSDYANFVATTASAQDAAALARTNALQQGYVQPSVFDVDNPDDPIVQRRAHTLAGWNPAAIGRVGAAAWSEFGIIGLPVRRRDFIKIGSAGAAGTDWSTITGVFVTVQTTSNVAVNVSFDDCYLTGGYGPDTSEPGTQKFDYRVVNYDPRTGARSNGSTTQVAGLWLDALRQAINITPVPYVADPAIRQEAYRRGGSLISNWYFVGRNTSDGGLIVDTLGDADLTNADVLPVNHFQPIATVDANGVTVLNQPLPVVFGPFDDGTVCGLGDPYRPGYVYACLPGEVDHWPSTGTYAVEACAPAEELMNGCVIGDGGFVLSRERGYAVRTNLSGGTGIVVTPTNCVPGLAARWGFTTGPGGAYYVARDGVRVTNGSDSVLLSDALWPLFHGQARFGYAPVDFNVPAAIRLSVWDNDLWFLYQDTNGARQCLVFSLLYQYWRPYNFAAPPYCAYSDETTEKTAIGMQQLIHGAATGTAYTHSGTTDNGTPISCSGRTGALSLSGVRTPKLLGDLVWDADLQGQALTLRILRDLETITDPAIVSGGVAGLHRYTLDLASYPTDPAGTSPRQATTLSLNWSFLAPAAGRVELDQIGVSVQPLPDVTVDRELAWGVWSSLSDKYLKGFLLDADTFGLPQTVIIEADGVPVVTVTPILHNGRRVQNYTFPQVLGRVFRVRPTGTALVQVHTIQPIFDEEPLALSRWETQLLDFDLPGSGWGSILSADLCLKSTAGVVVTLAIYDAQGRLLQTIFGVDVTTQLNVVTATGGAKQKRFVTFPANKGVLFKIILTATDGSAISVYQEEGRLRIKPWAGQRIEEIKLLGNDGLDRTRDMRSAVISAARSGGGS